MFKNLLLAGAFALSATAGFAATCDVGTCTVSGADGQALSSGVLFELDAIHDDGGSDSFQFSADFLNDTSGDADAAVTVLQFQPTDLGSIGDLVLTITGPAAITPQSFTLTDSAGFAINPTGNDIEVRLSLGATQGSLIDFTLTGNALPGNLGSAPDLTVVISAVPLPAGVLLMGTALAGLGFAARRRKSS